jgi:transposase InsO family protein
MILELVKETVQRGAREEKACEVLGLAARTLQRWRNQDVGNDLREGPKAAPKNKLSASERQEVLEVANSPEHRDLSPKQIVPKLADEGCYVASESTMYRVLREEHQLHHREISRPATHHRPQELVATGPKQVWSWDITYLLSTVKGVYFYLYLVMDVWSRKIVGWAVHEAENGEHASALLADTCAREGVPQDQVTLHQDNGAPMKCGTFLALLQWLGVAASFSRPGVSDDNPFSEALFRTLKFRPEFPGIFATIEEARAWIAAFVHWYNTLHRHSNIRFVTPEERHSGRDREILAHRAQVYAKAKARHPERWSGRTRNWGPIEVVTLNPASSHTEQRKTG